MAVDKVDYVERVVNVSKKNVCLIVDDSPHILNR
jgi:hypothetical protein